MRCKICSKTFRSPPPRMRESQICTECQETYVHDTNANLNSKNNTKFYSNIVDMENVAEGDIDISRGQAEFLKSIMRYIRIGEFTPTKLRQVLNRNIEMKYFVNENWGDEEYFINLALNEKDSNQISQILYFLNIKNKIEKVPTKLDMKVLSVIDISEYENKFRSWENFLDLMGFDPWYRKETIKKETRKSLKISKKQFLQYETNYFNDNDSFEETIEKINNLRNQIEENYRQKDSEENYSDYSYVEMFQLLEKYLKILPNKPKYGNIKNLI